jgi:hypothetical protein
LRGIVAKRTSYTLYSFDTLTRYRGGGGGAHFGLTTALPLSCFVGFGGGAGGCWPCCGKRSVCADVLGGMADDGHECMLRMNHRYYYFLKILNKNSSVRHNSQHSGCNN